MINFKENLVKRRLYGYLVRCSYLKVFFRSRIGIVLFTSYNGLLVRFFLGMFLLGILYRI